jgi:DNA-binding CsgD family transcriptional regulator
MPLFDIFTEGVAVCAADGRLLHQNTALAEMRALDPEHTRVLAGISALAREAADASAGRGGRTSGTASCSVRTASARYSLCAIVSSDPALLGAPVTLVRAERMAGGLPSLETLRARFALTMAEARIVPLLAARHTNVQIARALGISPHTVRHHAERAFLKLRVHRRTEIAARLSRLICV